MLTTIIAGILSVTLSQFAFWDRWLPKKRECPECDSQKIVKVDTLVKDIQTREIGALSISSEIITNEIHTYRCQTCGHAWKVKDRNKRT